MRNANLLLALLLLASGTAVAKSKSPPKKPIAPVAIEDAAVPTAPSAPAKPVPKTGVSSILGLLDWGASHGDVLASLRSQIEERYARELEELRDPYEIDKTLRRKNQELAGVEQTYVRFTGDRSGYESSLIAQDYVPDSEESVLRIDDRAAQRYFFFKNDRLWKVLVAYNTSVSRAVPFADFARQVEEKYGNPAATEQQTLGGQKSLRSATWRDSLTELVVEDRSEFFGTFVMKFLDLKHGVALEAERSSRRGQARVQVSDDPMVASTLAEITAGGGDGPSDEDSAVVDRLTGTQHDVDLQRGKPVYETINRGPAQSPIYPDDAGRKGGKKGGKKGGGKAPDRKPEPSKSAEPLIIY